MTKGDEIKRIIELKRQAMQVLESAHRNRMAELASEIKTMRIKLRDTDHAEATTEIDLSTPAL